MTANNIAKFFDMSPMPYEFEPKLPDVYVKSSTEKVEDDFERARKNTLEILDIVGEAVKNAASLAQQSQDPEQYDVTSKLLDTYVRANKSLLDLQKQIRDLKTHKNSNDAKIINNNLFVGSTQELQKFLIENDR